MNAWYRNIDWLTVLSWLVLVGMGLVAIYSSTHGPGAEHLHASVQQNFYRQLAWLVVAAGVLAGMLLLTPRTLMLGAYPLYGLTLVLLVATIFMGREVGGGTRWLALGPIRLQASELAKVGTVLAVARLLSDRRAVSAQHLGYVLRAAALVAVPAVLVLLQNDTGTALVFIGLIPIVLFWGGLPVSLILLMLVPGLALYAGLLSVWAAVAVVVIFTAGMWIGTRHRLLTLLAGGLTTAAGAIASFALVHVLRPHQVARIISFTNPEAEEFRQGVGFHLVQSKAAIGSGGIWGKGFMEGTQTQGAYIPEQSTDFVFSVIAEEFGLVGGGLVLIVMGFFLLRLIKLGADSKHPFGSLVAAGAVGVYLIHTVINLGMVMGMMPVVGLPLPFLSYGGSALVSYTLLLAIVVSIHMRRDSLSIYGY
ncbi:MAG: rod shape-determining protein RodA [Longimonas sp.]|uniref:rod shape-determining protein RodA n=1 Tax=Longimonas sp. TaxID=2039626 RepID=UPI00335587BA